MFVAYANGYNYLILSLVGIYPRVYTGMSGFANDVYYTEYRVCVRVSFNSDSDSCRLIILDLYLFSK